MPTPLSAVPSSLPTPAVLPPESVRDFLANGMLCLRANTSVTLESAFQPVGAYEHAMQQFQKAIDYLDKGRA